MVTLGQKKTSGRFDVTMGAYDGAEVCELVELFLLHHLSLQLGKAAVELHWDDELAIIRNSYGPEGPSGNPMAIPSTTMFDPTTLLHLPSTYPW